MSDLLARANLVDFVCSHKQQSLGVMEKISPDEVGRLIRLLAQARQTKRQIFICGNGGSAATASHFANDLGKGASYGRSQRFRVYALTDSTPWITALANDVGYSQIFVEQLKNHAEAGDLLIAFSGSGNSPNVVEAIKWGNDNGVTTVGITGRPGGELGRLARYPFFIESSHMGHIEEGHFLIQHMVSYYFMDGEHQR